MKNNFAEIYSQHEALAARYNEASQKNDREGMEQAREEHRALNEKVAANGRAYARLYELYADARERGNDYIDLSEIYDYKDEAQLIADMREYDIEAFTFSSSWTQALESAWLFTQNGCTLEGMVEINEAATAPSSAPRPMWSFRASATVTGSPSPLPVTLRWASP